MEPIKRALAARVNHRCSKPDCYAPTTGPQDEPTKTVNLGVAAHIAGAAPGGPRYDPTMTAEERAGISNGVWLCQNCAKLVDNDPAHFTAALLREWKIKAEERARDQVGKPSPRQDVVQIIDKWVNESYPTDAGMTDALRAAGYKTVWCTANNEARRVDLEGWERVVIDEQDGTNLGGHLKTGQTATGQTRP